MLIWEQGDQERREVPWSVSSCVDPWIGERRKIHPGVSAFLQDYPVALPPIGVYNAARLLQSGKRKRMKMSRTFHSQKRTHSRSS